MLLHSVSRSILTPCLWTVHYHYPHFTDEKTYSRTWTINHCNILAHNRESATSQAVECWTLSYAQKVSTPCFYLCHTSLSLLQRGRNRYAIILQPWSTDVDGKLRGTSISWMLNTIQRPCAPAFLTYLFSLSVHLLLLRVPCSKIVSPWNGAPFRHFPHQHGPHHRKNYKNDLTLVRCYASYKTLG